MQVRKFKIYENALVRMHDSLASSNYYNKLDRPSKLINSINHDNLDLINNINSNNQKINYPG